MTRRRRAWLGLLAAAGVAFAAEIFVLLPDSRPRPVSLQAGRDRIEVGMTLAEVEAVLGEDRGHLPEGHGLLAGNSLPTPRNRGTCWFGGDMVLYVWFAEDADRVLATEALSVARSPQPSALARVRRWLRI